MIAAGEDDCTIFWVWLLRNSAAEQRPELSPGRVCEPWVHSHSNFGAAERRLNSCMILCDFVPCDSIQSIAAPQLWINSSCVTQRSQSLALGLTLTAAPQLVEL
jgi:hypothetical protein